MFFSSGDVYVGELLKFHQGCQGPFQGSRGKVGFLSRHHSGKRPHHSLRRESPGFSRVAAGNLRFLSSYDGDLWDPLVLPQESEFSTRVARGLLGFLSIRCRVLGPHLELRPEPQVSLQCLSGSWGSYGVSKGHQASSRVETCKSTSLSSCNSSVQLPVELT